jgi:hypothetical protein
VTSRHADIEAIDAAEDTEGEVVGRAAIESVAQQQARPFDVSAVEGVEALMHERLVLALAFGLCASSAFDVRACAIVVPIEEQHAGPEVDGGFEPTGEVLIEPGDEELLDTRIFPGTTGPFGRTRSGGERIGHGQVVHSIAVAEVRHGGAARGAARR